MRSAALAFLCGILLIQQMPALPSLWWGLLLLPAIAFATYRPRLLPLVFFLAGALWLTVRAGLLLNDALAPAMSFIPALLLFAASAVLVAYALWAAGVSRPACHPSR